MSPEHDAPPAGAAAVPAEPAPPDFPCSLAQERFWLLDRLDPGNASYNVAVRWRLEGTVSSALLEQAWLSILERHEVLRSVFFEIDGAPRQRALPRSAFKLAEIDLSNLPEPARAAEADRIGAIEARAPFDLLAGPMIRATLLRLEPAVSIILVTTHQIVSDGWSIGVMAREMGAIYRALRNGAPPPFDELPLQYADYAQWQLEWLKARGTEAETAYWTRQLDGVKPFSVLPDHPRPAVPTTNGAIASMVLPRELTQRAQALSATHGATLFATALAALTAMLHRYTGETEIVLGTQVSDRDQVELEGMVGQFVNSLILRNDLSGDPRFGELVERCRDTGNAALEHRHIPIERLLGMVKAARDGTHSALISVNFIFQRTFIENADYGDFRLVDLPSLPAGAIYDLNFFMVERLDGWRFSCQYNTDQFDAETVQRLLRYVERVLASAVEAPEQRLSALPLIDAAETARLLEASTTPSSEMPQDETIASLFAAQVRRTPSAIAVTAAEVSLTYRALDTAANRLAHWLIARGVRPGQRIGLCVGRSVRLPTAVLAVARVGASYVPLDASDPPARLEQLATVAGITRVLVTANTRSELAGTTLTLIDLDAEQSALGRCSGDPPALAVAPDSEAYVTRLTRSADRGPALLRHSHRALIARLWSLRERPGLAAQDVLVATSPLTLDLAPFELLLPLLVGAHVVIAGTRERTEGAALLQLLQRSQATVMHAVPSVWMSLLDAGWQGQPRIRVICSGESRDRRLAGQLLDRCAELWSLYVCPEATIAAAAHRMLPNDDTVAIGRPLAGTRLVVLDARGQLVPTGAPGELCVGGATLAASDESDDAAAAGSSVPDPFGSSPGERVLRTGDLARVRADGCIEGLGRRDERVTVDGIRIEPHEIEAILARHPGVEAAAVTILRESPGRASIVAFVTAQPSAVARSSPLVASLREALESSLPRLCRPDRIVALPALPQRADGSLDRSALRALARAGDDAGQRRPAQPTTAAEIKLRAIWQAMLKLPEVDLDANFFELGGHSLLAARMLGRIEAEFGRRVSLAALFRAPSIRALAELLEREDVREFDFRQVVRLQAVGTRQPVIGINNTGIYYLLAKKLGADQPFTSLQLFDPSVKTDQLPDTLEEVAAGYVQLIRRVQPQGPYSLMGWCVAGALAFEIARQLDEQDAGLAHVYLMDSWVPNYFARLPKLRRLIAQYSLRWQFIRADWRRTHEHRQGVLSFIANRKFVRAAAALLGPSEDDDTRQYERREATPEDYDQWLLGYLQQLTARYEPRPFRGRLTLFRSRSEPTGWWFDPHAGWSPFAAGGIELHLVDGDHFTMFQDPGVTQMAEQIGMLVPPAPR